MSQKSKSNPRNAGRKPIGEVAGIEKKIRLTPDQWERLKQVADGGSYAAGVRVLLDGCGVSEPD